ncbi:TetR/AcrR family transcriptional regulator [Streptomyces mayteni]
MAERMTTGRGLVGRPRDAHIDTAVLDAVSELLEESGYGALAVEKVARHAGVSKTAVYRRWPTRQQLVLAELQRRLGDVGPVDTGCTLCDLNEALGMIVRTFTCMGPEFFSPLLADCSADPALRQEFMDTLFQPPREAVRTTLARAVARGDLRADADLTLVVDSLASLVHYRLLFGHAPVNEAAVEQAIDTLLAGVARDFDALRAQADAEADHRAEHHHPRHR